MLDSKEISDTSRQFLQNWKASKDAQKKRKEDMDRFASGDNSSHYSNSLSGLG